jgi:hypothetical protein
MKLGTVMILAVVVLVSVVSLVVGYENIQNKAFKQTPQSSLQTEQFYGAGPRPLSMINTESERMDAMTDEYMTSKPGIRRKMYDRWRQMRRDPRFHNQVVFF